MPELKHPYTVPPNLVLGQQINRRISQADQERQRAEVEEVLRRLRKRPGVIVADEVGMGKTFVALAVAYCVSTQSPRGPVIIMVPPNLIEKWVQDLRTFCDFYLRSGEPVCVQGATRTELRAPTAYRFGTARDSVTLMRLLDDPPRSRCQVVFLAQGAMGRSNGDKWIRLALIAETLRRHGRGRARRLIKVKETIHRFLGELTYALGEQRATTWGEDIWAELLTRPFNTWRETFNVAVANPNRRLDDDPVPKSVVRALPRVDLKKLAGALCEMPVRASGGNQRVSERITEVRSKLGETERLLWTRILTQARWRSPLLVMDEAHHLKNSDTLLARQLQTPELDSDLRTGDGAMANAFDRMLFLTATPLQLGHHELVSVLERFGDVRWEETELGESEKFLESLIALRDLLDRSQRAAIRLQKAWVRLDPSVVGGDSDDWWRQVSVSSPDDLSFRTRAVVDAFRSARQSRDAAQPVLRHWVMRHNKGRKWPGTSVERRKRLDGAAGFSDSENSGLTIPDSQILPFFLAARSAAVPGRDLLGDALSSSYEAFRFTREQGNLDKDGIGGDGGVDLSNSGWYLEEFDRALDQSSGFDHPKMSATVRRVADLWASGEKVLVFAFYRRTCEALRIHISDEIERRTKRLASIRLAENVDQLDSTELDKLVGRIQDRYIDIETAPGRRALDAELNQIVDHHERSADLYDDQRRQTTEIMRRFLRVRTTLLRCFPIAEFDAFGPVESVKQTLDNCDASGVSWRRKFEGFVTFLLDDCSESVRTDYLEAAASISTGDIRVIDRDTHAGAIGLRRTTLANVQVATGQTKRDTRARLMRAFNTPFFPDVLVCSQVMGEGVDLQRYCRHVVHHDLDWNPSTIEQRTGRIDRLGCKAERTHAIEVYLPYLAGTADERQYKVMTDREKWFRVVMGQDEVARLITPDSESPVALPDAIGDELSFDLGISDYQ